MHILVRTQDSADVLTPEGRITNHESRITNSCTTTLILISFNSHLEFRTCGCNVRRAQVLEQTAYFCARELVIGMFAVRAFIA